MATAAATDGAHPDGSSGTSKAPSAAPLPRGVVPLPVPGFDPALVSFPGAPAPSPPLIVVAHGAKDLPDAQCKLWRAVAGDAPVLLCLAGPRADVKIEPRYFPDHRTLEQIVVASVTALGAAYPSVDTKTAIYAGYSQGATMGALILGAHAGELPRLALVEGGFDGWTVAGAAAFKSGGGDRVLFACGTRRCLEHAAISARFFRAAGVEARVVFNLAEGHAYGPRMERLLRGAFDWLTANDARYSSPEAAAGSGAANDARSDGARSSPAVVP